MTAQFSRSRRVTARHFRGATGSTSTGAGNAHGPSQGVRYSEGQLEILFPNSKPLDCNLFLKREMIGIPIAHAIYALGIKNKPTSREKTKQKFAHFFKFLDIRELTFKHQTVVALGQISTEVIDDYASWMDGTLKLAKASQPLSDLTKKAKYNVVREAFDWLKASKQYGHLLDQNLSFSSNLWKRAHRMKGNQSSLSLVDVRTIRKVCKEEISQTISFLAEGRRMVLDEGIRIATPTHRSVSTFATLERCVKGVYLSKSALPYRSDGFKRDFPGLYRSLKSPYHSSEMITKHLHFTARTIVPFIILIALELIYNSKTIIDLKTTNVSMSHPLWGPGRLRVDGEKGRANRKQRRSPPVNPADPFCASSLLKTVGDYTKYTRDLISLSDKQKFFIFRGIGAVPFGSFDGDGSSTWGRNLSFFIADNRLPKFTLKTLRRIGGELVDLMSGGDIVVQQMMMRHASAKTTFESYQTPAMVKRHSDALAHEMSRRERRIRSGGKIDNRTGMMDEGRNTAATPPFTCLEPFSSPILGQVIGRMCSAYGSCPTCPNAAMDRGNPRAYLRMKQLQARFHQASRSLITSRWMAMFAPQLLAVETIWLPMFSEAVVSRSQGVVLPQIPEIE